ncbi:hypothetical protein [Nonomuraea rhizosphaerae]|uniref:hypothetical protein n=1 Tax=Nonomuraea rhizosphaerae TaxID=2665663 RepID=UPI001C5D85AB|nr:hypothetical protein [Nonomuraea rhizosphaerae]
MKAVIEQLHSEKTALAEQEFFRWLREPSPDDVRKLAFARAMCSYVMSFRDLLLLLQDRGSDDPLQQAINAYVDEDAPHYKWYLQDLGKVSAEPFHPVELWDPKLLPSRRTIYRMIGYAMDNPPIPTKLLLVSIFEATGEVFLRHTRDLLLRIGMDEELSYFGSVHYADEVQHTVDLSILTSVELTDAQRVEALRIVTLAFTEYRALFESWRLYAQEH